MILPSKHLSQDRALLTIGGLVLQRLQVPKTVSALWEELSARSVGESGPLPSLSYDWFVLSLDLLFALKAIEFRNGLLIRHPQ